MKRRNNKHFSQFSLVADKVLVEHVTFADIAETEHCVATDRFYVMLVHKDMKPLIAAPLQFFHCEPEYDPSETLTLFFGQNGNPRKLALGS